MYIYTALVALTDNNQIKIKSLHLPNSFNTHDCVKAVLRLTLNKRRYDIRAVYCLSCPLGSHHLPLCCTAAVGGLGVGQAALHSVPFGFAE